MGWAARTNPNIPKMTQKYFGSFTDHTILIESFFERPYTFNHVGGYGEYGEPAGVPADFPTDEQILFASYGGRAYEGDALVVYQHAGQLYEVNGSHCSCFGLEGQWSPEATSWDALKMRPTDLLRNEHETEAIDALQKLCDAQS